MTSNTEVYFIIVIFWKTCTVETTWLFKALKAQAVPTTCQRQRQEIFYHGTKPKPSVRLPHQLCILPHARVGILRRLDPLPEPTAVNIPPASPVAKRLGLSCLYLTDEEWAGISFLCCRWFHLNSNAFLRLTADYARIAARLKALGTENTSRHALSLRFSAAKGPRLPSRGLKAAAVRYLISMAAIQWLYQEPRVQDRLPLGRVRVR